VVVGVLGIWAGLSLSFTVSGYWGGCWNFVVEGDLVEVGLVANADELEVTWGWM
jgi:hypothetical protein